MFGNKSKQIARLEEIVKNQNNLINNTNISLTAAREAAEALRSRNHELNELLIKKDIAMDKLEDKAQRDRQYLANMLEVFGFDAQKVLRQVTEREGEIMWVNRAMAVLKDFQENQVKRFIQTPMSDMVFHLSDKVLRDIPGYSVEGHDKEFFRQLGYLVMTINGLASEESLGKTPKDLAADKTPSDTSSE